MKTICLFTTILMVSQLSSQHVLAAGKETRPTGSTSTNRQTSNNQTITTSTGATDGMRGSASLSPTIKDGASNAAKEQGGGSGANAAMGAGLMAAGAAMMINETTRPVGMMMMMMGAQALMQAGNQSGTQKSNADTANKMSYNPSSSSSGGLSDPTTGVDPKDPFGNPASLTRTSSYKQAMANLKKAEALGLKIDPKAGTATLPNGKTVPLTSAGMASSGLGSSAFQAAKREADKLSEKAFADMKKSLVSSMGEDGGGGGGFGSSSSSSSSEEESDAALGVNAESNSLADRGAASVAGLTKDFNGEPIGVAGDSIFDMIARRYQRKDKQDFFIQDVTTSAK
ncbi:MAG: hypothetical protein AB7O96_07285 [Pseudobdellovibrionaceae bacterium]